MSNTRDTDDKAYQAPLPSGAAVDPSPSLTLLGQWNAELFGFYAQRVQQYWALPLKFLSCKSATDAIDVQEDFHSRLIEDYRSQARKLSEIAASDVAGSEADERVDYAAEVIKAQADADEIITQAKVQAERILASAKAEAAKLAGDTKPKREKAA